MTIFWRQRMCKISSMTRNSDIMLWCVMQHEHTFYARLFGLKANEKRFYGTFLSNLNWNILSFSGIEALSRREGDESLVNGTNFDNGVLMRNAKNEKPIDGQLITHAKLVPQKRRLSAGARKKEAKNVVFHCCLYCAKIKIKLKIERPKQFIKYFPFAFNNRFDHISLAWMF